MIFFLIQETELKDQSLAKKKKTAKTNTLNPGRKASSQYDFSTLEILFYQIFFNKTIFVFV